MTTELQSDMTRAQELLKRKHRLTVKGAELACDFLGPILRETTTDPRALAALAALETACALRRKRK